MLPPDVLEHLPDRLVQSLEGLCEDITADMARRISKTGFLTETAVHQYTRLRELYGREVYDYVLEHLREWTQYTKAELHELFEEAGEAALQYDNEIYRAAGFSPAALSDSPALLALVQAGWEKTGGLFENLVRTTAEGTQIAFIEASDRAHWQVLSGAFDYQTAIKNAVMEIADAGPIVRYPSGARVAVDVAVRRCVLTGVNQTCCKVQEARMDELGCTLVETTAHAGARPSHMVWQGRVFSRFGQTDQYEDFVTATGYGTGNGLGGWNCRHSFFPYFEGLSENAYPKEELREMESKTVFYNGEEIPLYDATQMQRKNERDIRRHKRRIAGLEAAGVEKKDVQAAKAALRQAQAKQRDFCSQTGLQRDYFRERGDKQNRISSHTSLKLALQKGDIKNVLTDTLGNAIIKVSKTSLISTPGSITQYENAKGGIDRNYYGSDGRQIKQISNYGHGNPKLHPFGLHGEHAHDYIWDSDRLVSRLPREMTDDERKQNGDIL